MQAPRSSELTDKVPSHKGAQITRDVGAKVPSHKEAQITRMLVQKSPATKGRRSHGYDLVHALITVSFSWVGRHGQQQLICFLGVVFIHVGRML